MKCIPLSVLGRCYSLWQVFGIWPPGEASLHHPSSWQQHEATFSHGMLDHFESDAMLLGGLHGVRPRVPLIDIG
jgi:hypothetical protein